MSWLPDLENAPICKEAVELVGEYLARGDCVLPISLDSKGLHLILPHNDEQTHQNLVEKIRFIFNRDFSYEIADRERLEPLVDFHCSAVFSDIKNCDPSFAFQCPKRWAELRPTDDHRTRFCETCSQNVHFCLTAEELRMRMAPGECVAFYNDEYREPLMGLPAKFSPASSYDGDYLDASSNEPRDQR